MSTHTVSSSRKAARRAFLAKARQCVLILVFLLSLLGMNPAEIPAVQANGGWTAYNDCAGTSPGNVTGYTITSGDQTGELIDFATGEGTGVTVTVSSGGSPGVQTQSGYNGAETAPGTDAYETFHEKADMAGVIYYGDEGWYVDVAFSGLNPARMYTFATSANRDGDYTRNSRFTILGVDAAENASTEGVTVRDEGLTIVFNTGDNTENGYVARWTNIQPGADGTFTVRVQADSSREAYGPSVFQLIEMPTDLPQYTLSVVDDGNGSVTLDPPGGVYNEGTTVNLTPVGEPGFAFDQWSGPNAGNLTDNGDGTWSILMNGNKEIAANFTVSTCSTISLTSVADTRLRGSQATTNFGGEDTVTVNANGSSYSQVGLIRWDLSSIPPGATIESASITLNVVDATNTQFPLYRLLRDWIEGTGKTENTPSSNSANWNTYDGVNSWGTAGARSTTSDRENTNLWDSTALSATGLQTRSLNSDGVAVLQSWLADPSSNYGFTLQNIASNHDYLEFSSKEEPNESLRPRLNVTYCLPSTDPIIVVSGALSSFETTPGVPSEPQTYTVAGSNLTDDITITVPNGFELSTDGNTYTESLVLHQANGVVASTNVYVRLNSISLGSYTGNIVHTSSEANTVNLPVSGVVSPVKLCSEVSLTSVADTRLRNSQASTNFGSETTVTISPFTSSPQVGLIRWDLSSIPAEATINSASITLNVSDASEFQYYMYSLKRNWVESAATWNRATSSTNWGTAGAQNTTTDRGTTNLWDTTPITSTGPQTRSLNSDGVAVLQSWLENPSSNYGVIIQNTSGSSSSRDYLVFSSREETDASRQPKLNINYCEPSTAPTIVVSGALSPFTSWPGEYSDPQTYKVRGLNLTGDITISAPAGFGLSLDDNHYFSDLHLSPSGDGIVAETTVYVRLFSEDPGDFSGNITHISEGAASTVIAVSGTVSDDNRAPGKPALVGPTDGGTANLPPTLEVTVSDPDGDPLDVSFYGREAGGASGEDFMLVYIPDPQNESQYAPQMFTAQTQWIADNKEALNIVFVTTSGDMVNTSSSHEQYQNADAAVDILDAGGVWYTMAPGNHDSAYGTSYYAQYFGLSRYDDYHYEDGFWFGGGYNDFNTYSLFSASGNDFILINLQFNPGSAVLNWADQLLKQYSDRRAIVSQHDILNVNDTWNNQASFNALRDNPNLFLMLCGHMHAANDGAAYRAETGTDGHTIHIVQADYQDMNRGNGYLRLLSFSPADDMIYMTTYSPYADASITTYPDQMELAYDLADVGDSFELIGTAENVSSGSNASIVWNGLTAGVDYEWYAVASDGELEASSDVWSFTTTAAANHPPVIAEGPEISVTMSEDGSPTAFNLTLHATDGDGDTLTWSILTPAEHGTAAAGGTGTTKVIAYTPQTNYFGSDSFVVQVSDGNGGTDSITVNVTIEPVNDPPVITGQKALAADEDTPLTLSVNDLTIIDPDNVPSDFSLIVLAGDNYSVDGSTITPALNYYGSLTVPVKVNDGQLDSNLYELSITVNPVNDAPVALDDAYNTDINTTLMVPAPGVLNNDTDVEGDNLTAVIVSTTSHGDLTLNADGSFTYIPDTDWTGTDSFTYRANDGEAFSEAATVTITVSDDQGPPPLPSSFYGKIHILDNPPKAGDTVEVTISGVASPVSTVITTEDGVLVYAINVEGDISGTPEKEGGVDGDELIFRINGRIVATSTWQSDENTELNLHPPQPLPGGPYSGDVGTEISFTGSANDWGSDAITYQWDWDNDGTFDAEGANASHTWNVVDEHTAALKVTDAQGGEGLATFTVTVNNAAPILNEIGNQSVDELALLEFTASATDLDPLTFSLIDAPAGASIDNDGNFTWTPTEAQGPNDYDFTVSVCDNGTPSLCDSEEITVTVNEVNQAPVLDAIGDQTVDEGVELNFTASATDADLPANTLTYSLGDDAPDGAEITQGGEFTWTPTEEQGPGTYEFAVIVSDGTGTDNGTISVTVAEVNQAPVLNSIGDQSVNEGEQLSFTATATDADLPANPLTFSLDGAPAGASINASSGVFTWTPSEEQGPETHTFTVIVSDGEETDSETITVNVAEVNQAPVLQSIGNKMVIIGDTLNFTATATDVDRPANTLTYSLIDAPAGASIDASSGAFTWTPDEIGEVSFTIQVCDDALSPLCDEEVITVTVRDSNQAPVLDPIGNQAVDEGDLLTFTASAADPDEDELTFSLVGDGVPVGAAIDPTSGVFTWTPTEEQGPGNYAFTVKVCDNGSPQKCAEEQITVTVAEINLAPVLASIGNQTIDEGVELTFTAAATDADLPANTLTYSLVDAPEGATINESTGVFTWTPTEAQGPGSHTFTVKVCDEEPLCDEEGITVIVNEVNQAPALEAIGSQSVNELETLTFTATATDADLPANTLTYSLGNDAPAGASIDASSGAFTWTPTEAQGPASYEFDVIVSDGEATDSETITVNVAEVNQAPVLQSIANKTVIIGDTLNFTATATDVDRPANTLAYSLIDAPAGAAINPSTGAFAWTPAEIDDVSFTVRVCDNGSPVMCDSEEITVSVIGTTITHEIDLVAGWNLISFSVHPDDTSIAAVLSSIAGNYSLVYAWDASGAHAGSGHWLKYDPNMPSVLNTLSDLDETMGFWIHMTAADTLEVTGEVVDESTITLSTGAGGWNLVGYPSAPNRSLPDALKFNGVEDFDLIYAHLANDPTDKWKLFDPQASGFPSDLKALSPGLGYWILVTDDATWSVSYRGE